MVVHLRLRQTGTRRDPSSRTCTVPPAPLEDLDERLGRRGAHRRTGLLEIRQGALGDQTATVEDDDPDRQVLDLGEEMARHDHGCPGEADELQHLVDASGRDA